jgi:hypothetical protein
MDRIWGNLEVFTNFQAVMSVDFACESIPYPQFSKVLIKKFLLPTDSKSTSEHKNLITISVCYTIALPSARWKMKRSFKTNKTLVRMLRSRYFSHSCVSFPVSLLPTAFAFSRFPCPVFSTINQNEVTEVTVNQKYRSI